jgi:hypothetical protein
MWRGVRGSPFSSRRRNATGEQAGPTPFEDTDTERGKPLRLPQGKVHRKGTEGRGGMGGGSKRRPLCNGTDRGMCPPRKRADFPLVSRHERVC